MQPLVALANVALSLQGRQVLADVTLAVTSKKTLCLHAPSGAGKTTLLLALAGLLLPDSGVRAATTQKIGFAFQEDRLILWLTLEQNLRFVLCSHRPRREAAAIAGRWLGRSGSGKSTLLNLLGGLDRPTRGSIRAAGREFAGMSSREFSLYRRDVVGFIFQSFNLVSSQKAWENVALPLVFQGVPRGEWRRRAHALLERVGLGRRAGHTPGKMSGGEQQRVAIARALVNNPRMLLCDEPTGNLDTATSAQIMGLLNEAHRAGTTLTMVTHDPSLAEAHAQRTLRMADGQFEEAAQATA